MEVGSVRFFRLSRSCGWSMSNSYYYEGRVRNDTNKKMNEEVENELIHSIVSIVLVCYYSWYLVSFCNIPLRQSKPVVDS